MKNLQVLSLKEMKETEGGFDAYAIAALIGAQNLYNFGRGFASAFN